MSSSATTGSTGGRDTLLGRAWNASARAPATVTFAIVTASVVLSFWFGERVQKNAGVGWDGVNYVEMVRRLDAMIRDGTLNTYYAQRTLPSVVVGALMRLFDRPLTEPAIADAFYIYNGVLLAALVPVWKRIADHLDLGVPTRWLVFAGVFLNYEASKQALFNPVLTDVTALFVASVQLLAYLSRQRLLLLVASVVGAFVWPTISLCGALLLIFSRVRLNEQDRASEAVWFVQLLTPRWLILALLSLYVVSFALTGLMPDTFVGCTAPKQAVAALLTHMPGGIAAAGVRVMQRISLCQVAFRVLTAVPAIVVLGAALLFLFTGDGTLRRLLRQLRAVRVTDVVLGILAIAIPWLVVRTIANPNAVNPSGLGLLLYLTLSPRGGMVFLPFVTLAVFWGPVFLLGLLLWPRLCAAIRGLGAGVMLSIAAVLILGLVAEPRFLTGAWPMIVAAVMVLLERCKWDRRIAVPLSVSSLFYAQFWLPAYLAPWDGTEGAILREFPQQLYFMHYGLWMGTPFYVAQLGALVVTAGWFATRLPIRGKGQEEASDAQSVIRSA